jgi:hypothetical protein
MARQRVAFSLAIAEQTEGSSGLMHYVAERKPISRYPEFCRRGWQIGSGPSRFYGLQLPGLHTKTEKPLRKSLPRKGLEWVGKGIRTPDHQIHSLVL